MKVKITYTVDLEDVPSEVSALIENIQSQMEEFVSEKLEELHPITSENIAGTLETIDHVRRSMAKYDERLEDCYAILFGYHQNKLASQLPEPTQQETEEFHKTLESNLAEKGNL